MNPWRTELGGTGIRWFGAEKYTQLNLKSLHSAFADSDSPVGWER